VAALSGHKATARLLLDHGAGIEAKNESGLTPLHSAAWKGHEITVRLLLNYGANIKAKDVL
jgi:ankyrin repeat protein